MPQDFTNTKPALVIVDDDPDQLCLIRIAAERVGAYSRVMTAGDGAAAMQEVSDYLNELSEAVPLIILTDLKMPRVSGIDLARRLRRQALLPALRLVAMSNSAYEPDVEAALSAGCCAFIQKPSGFPELKRMVASLPAVCKNAETAPQFIPEAVVSFA